MKSLFTTKNNLTITVLAVVEVDFLGSADGILDLLLLFDRDDLLIRFLKPILHDFFRFCFVSSLIISSCLLVIRPPLLTAKGGGWLNLSNLALLFSAFSSEKQNYIF